MIGIVPYSLGWILSSWDYQVYSKSKDEIYVPYHKWSVEKYFRDKYNKMWKENTKKKIMELKERGVLD